MFNRVNGFFYTGSSCLKKVLTSTIIGFIAIVMYLSLNAQSAISSLQVNKNNHPNAYYKTSNPSSLFYATLKKDKAYLRKGAGKAYNITLQYNKRHLPLEVIAQHHNWWRVRDSKGNTGWIHKNLLSPKKRMALVNPWSDKKFLKLYKHQKNQKPIALLERNLLIDVISCSGSHCYVKIANKSGYISQDLLWGVYPNEVITR